MIIFECRDCAAMTEGTREQAVEAGWGLYGHMTYCPHCKSGVQVLTQAEQDGIMAQFHEAGENWPVVAMRTPTVTALHPETPGAYPYVVTSAIHAEYGTPVRFALKEGQWCAAGWSSYSQCFELKPMPSIDGVNYGAE